MILAAVLVGGWLVLKSVFHIGEKVYAEAAGHKIYREEVKDLIGDTKGISDHDAATALADKYFTEALAKEQGITVTDKDIQEQLGRGADLKKQKKDNHYIYQTVVNNAYFDKLQAKLNGVYKGYMIIVHFDRYIPATPVSDAYKKAIPQMGDPKAIKADKEYAKQFIDKLYEQLRNHKITWEEAAKMEQDDPRVGRTNYPTASHSGPFDTSKAPVTAFNAPVAQGEVSQLKKGAFTKPFPVPVYNPDTKKNPASYYLIVRMDSKYGGSAKGNFFTYTLDAKKRLHYAVNV
ncbi:MAG TPA: hypothetical protein VFX84_00420 [Candidatus Saccharimonadales bacterium]|nr:hypothetical protein [Candidatus Saccharimonadales bacterium]